jgi:hypothetical protein
MTRLNGLQGWVKSRGYKDEVEWCTRVAKEGAVNGTPLGLEFWFIILASMDFGNLYYGFRFQYSGCSC